MTLAYQIQITNDASEDEAAAAVAVIAALLSAASPQPEEATTPPVRWRDGSKLVAQGLTPARIPARLGWGSIERLRRAGKGGSGITGM
ncbi:hypothetical protein [Candidatus Oscillochloris fontis]|uniref:hypothetical protein n=1 Tax=Candidatus Oscillochloris fontis TaxID=2496868 RepID=UPI001EE7C1C7|nr:hypothetical protein [Candidatus Oscillochloris fontis]